MTAYAELQAVSNYSFLYGASHPHELFQAAAHLGLSGLALTDRHTLAGAVRAHEAAKAAGVRYVLGVRLDLDDGTILLVYPTDRAAYGRLCRLLTLGKSRAGKGGCVLGWEDVAAHGEGLLVLLAPGEIDERLPLRLSRLAHDFRGRAYLALTLRRRPGDAERLDALTVLAHRHGVAAVATGDVLYHAPARRPLQDVLTAIREGCTVETLGRRRERFADRHLKSPQEMARLFARHPAAVERSLEILARCCFSLDELHYQYPHEAAQPGLTPMEELTRLTWEGARERYRGDIPQKTAAQITHELSLISELSYAPYFLTVHSIVRFARSKGILCQGRGSAANSAVCYCLGITAIDPAQSDLLFERFVSAERREPPDIDVDFDSGRREEVIQWIYETYGRERAALAATVIRYRWRSALRDVAKAMGFPLDTVAALANAVRGWDWAAPVEEDLRAAGFDPANRRLALTLELARELTGFPRHLSQHPGGFVLTEDRLDELVPIEPARMDGRQVIEWDKDDIEALRFMKVDILGLGMLGALAEAFRLLQDHKGIALSLAAIPPEDPATYAMIQEADTIGVFQIESRAQMSMLPRLKPRTFYDLVIEVAIVRPGPIQGEMVHPYLRRREGLEAVMFPSPAFERVLGKTLGVPLFQEQAMSLAIHCAGFTPAEADQLRRAMATFKTHGGIVRFRDKFLAGMEANGYAREFAARTFRMIEGFGSYGFPESHAASFALLAYASAWLKRHHADVFLCALLNAQPMGFYAPAQLVRGARAHGVTVRPPDINASSWDSSLEAVREPGKEGTFAVRLGLSLVKGLGRAEAERLAAARSGGAFASLEDLWRRVSLSRSAWEALAAAGAFASLGFTRRTAAWALKALPPEPLPLFAAAGCAAAETGSEPQVALRPQPEGAEVAADYRSVGLTLRHHPLAFLRPDLTAAGYVSSAVLATARSGARLALAGLVLVRQRPGSAKGVLFVTLEDEGGSVNIVVWPKMFARFRRAALQARLLGVRGRVQRSGGVVHLVAVELVDLSPLLACIRERGEGGAPESVAGGTDAVDFQVRSRDFH